MSVRRLLLVAVVVLVTAAAAAAGWWHWCLYRPGTHPATTVVVARGQSTVSILQGLEVDGLLPSALTARIYLELHARGRAPRFGQYDVAAGSTPAELLEQLLEGEVQTFTVTLIEGLSAAETTAALTDAGIGNPARWAELGADTAAIKDLAPSAASLEGYLFPDTYHFAVGVSAEAVAQHLVDRFRRVWREASAEVPVSGRAVEDIVALASLVEGETSVDHERAMIAGVYDNRLRRGMLLQCDPTVIYGLKERGLWTGRLLREHWRLDHPHNTYVYPGLPPGPINNPGRASIEAALEPASHEYLYFVAKPGGGHSFSRTLAEHNRAVWRLKRSRR